MNLKKFTQKNADGSSFTYEFDVPKMQDIPDHPGEPKGTDTVPAWLTPGEFVVNAEATRMFEPQIEAMNEAGRAVQRAQGGTIPEYHNDGGMAGNLAMVPRMGNMDMRMQSLIDAGYTPEEIEDAIGKLGNIGLLTDDLAVSLARTKNSNQPAVQDEVPQMSLEELAMSKLPQVRQEPMPESVVPQLNFRGQMPPVDDTAEIVKDALSNQRDFLKGRYSDDSRQQPAVPVSGIGTDLNIPKPEELPPINREVPFGLDGSVLTDTEGYKLLEKGVLNSPAFRLKELYDSSPALKRFIQQHPLAKGSELISDVYDKNKDEFIKQHKELLGNAGDTLKVIEDDLRKEYGFESRDTAGDATPDTTTSSDISSNQKDTDVAKQLSDLSKDPKANKEADLISNEGIDKILAIGSDTVNKTQEDPEGDQPGFLSRVTDFFQEHFSDMIDSDKLMNAALLYVGSRALGHSHAGSLNFVGRTYLGEIQKKLQVADKAALSNKYTKESVEKYRDTGKVEDLKLKQNIQLEGSEMLVNDRGEQVRVNKYKDSNTGKVMYQTEDGTAVERAKFKTLAEDNAQFDRTKKQVGPIYGKEIERLSGGDQDKLTYYTSVLPTEESIVSRAHRMANQLGLDSKRLGNLMPSITKQMINDLESKENITQINDSQLEHYLYKNLFAASIKDNEVKNLMSEADAEIVESINGMLPGSLSEKAESWRDFAQAYANLKNKSEFTSNIPKGYNSFTLFVKKKLDEARAKMGNQ